MKQYEKYLVDDFDTFEAANYPAVNAEIAALKQSITSAPSFYKQEIIISFLKNHSLQNVWIDANPQLTILVSSGYLFTGNIEALFEACRGNKAFRQDFEDYLTRSFAMPGNKEKPLVM